jgi:hypothetical protein
MTPAPWINDGKTISAQVDPEYPSYIAPVCFLDDEWSPEIVAANARLIAAAPELFAALEQAYYSLKLAAIKLELDESTEFYKDIDAAYRALQKAKGEPA